MQALHSQSCECPYPIIFIHGYTGSQDTYSGTIEDADFENIWGVRADIFHAVLNAQESSNIWGDDDIEGTSDDDVLYLFDNEDNVLESGCIYSINFENWWNEDENNPEIEQNTCSAPSAFSSNSNESAIYKQGYALGKMIDAVLDANPDKSKVIVVGHSMGGLAIREYLQRGGGDWWVGSDHNVKKAVTTVTPHLGSNFFGNITFKGDPVEQKNGLPDPFSEAARDLRYDYVFNPLDPFNCGVFASCPGPYLFGGDESMPWGYWNQDVNCDGDDDQEDDITGLNNSGGTYDNNTMPLPTDIRYTWVTSDIAVDNGDGVVALTRQWIYDGNIPMPSDGVDYRLSDTLLTDVGHLSVDDELNTVVRALDEADYPNWAWEIEVNNSLSYFGIPQLRSADVPDGPNTSDPDWFTFFVPAGSNEDLCIEFTPNVDLASTLEFFSSPGNYTSMASAGDVTLNLAAGSGTTTITIPNADLNLGGANYIRIIHDNIGANDWRTPYKLSPTLKTVVPIELSSFVGYKENDHILLEWVTEAEINNHEFQLLKSADNKTYEVIATIVGSGNSMDRNLYSHLDKEPFSDNYYQLRQIDFDGYTTTSKIIRISFSTDPINEMSVYPNPTTHVLQVDLNNVDQIANEQIEIFTVDGRLVQKVAIINEEVKVDVHSWAEGLYIIQLKTRAGTIKKMFARCR